MSESPVGAKMARGYPEAVCKLFISLLRFASLTFAPLDLRGTFDLLHFLTSRAEPHLQHFQCQNLIKAADRHKLAERDSEGSLQMFRPISSLKEAI